MVNPVNLISARDRRKVIEHILSGMRSSTPTPTNTEKTAQMNGLILHHTNYQVKKLKLHPTEEYIDDS